MKRQAIICCLGATLGALGCQVGPQLSPVAPKDYYVAAPAERVWATLLLVYTDLNVPIETMERASWFLRSGEMRMASGDAAETMDCGSVLGTPLASSIAVYVRVTTLLRPAGDSTAVRISVQARGWDQSDADLRAQGNIFAGDPNKACVGNGALEGRIVAHLEERLPAAP